MLARPGALSPHAQSGDWIENEPEGSPPMGRENSRRDLVFGWARRDPDHEAAIRFDGEAPGRRAHSSVGIAAMGSLRVTATSDRDQRPATRARPVTEIVLSAGPAIMPPLLAAARRPRARYLS